MPEHKSISGLQVLEFIIQLSWHLLQHRTLQMYYFIMRQNQNIFLTVCISHRKCHLIMIKFTEIWIQLHVFQEVVHPAHIPLQRESKPVVFCLTCYHRPCGRFLCDHDSSMISSENNGIQMLKKFNSLQILVSAVFIGDPLTVFLTVIQVEHGCNRIYTKTINVAFLYPVKSVCDQEILHLRTSVIVDLGSPIRMLTLSRICMLIYSSSVKVNQSVCILRKMCRYPVKNDTDFLTVKIIHQIFEILRCSVAGSRCVIAGYLIAPGTVKRMLCDTHKLHMGVSHFFDILCKLRRQFSVGIETILILCCLRMLHPGTRMHLIDRHGTCVRIKVLAIFHPGIIFPFIVGDICNTRGCSGTHFSGIGIWICLVKLLTMCTCNVKFIQLSDLRSRYKCLINANGSNFFHGILLRIPFVEFTYNRNRLCIRCPHCKINPFFPVLRIWMCSQLPVNIIIRALTKQILVKLRKL